ncbi:MAG: DUF4143 domain-containing protein, partial [Coriobacteriia bacterium]|nr:DUF4143 domain-containing protein [Coriobacteriia bacterium]
SINLTSRIRKAPKLHVMDTGLCAYLLGWPNGETIEKSTMCGAFFESWVFAELYKSFSYAGLSPQFYYYRDNKKNEIDLLIPEGLTLHPIEIKMTASPKSDDIKAFRVLDKVLDKGGIGYHVGVGALICMVREPVTLQPNAFTVPAWSI